MPAVADAMPCRYFAVYAIISAVAMLMS